MINQVQSISSRPLLIATEEAMAHRHRFAIVACCLGGGAAVALLVLLVFNACSFFVKGIVFSETEPCSYIRSSESPRQDSLPFLQQPSKEQQLSKIGKNAPGKLYYLKNSNQQNLTISILHGSDIDSEIRMFEVVGRFLILD